MTFHWEISLFLAAGSIGLGLAGYALTRPPSPLRKAMAAWNVAYLVWTFSYSLALASDALAGKYLWVRVGFFGVLPSIVLSLFVALEITGIAGRWVEVLKRALLVWGLVVLGLVWTSDFHTLFWTGYELVPEKIQWVPHHGPAFQIYQLGAVLVMLALAGIYARYLVTCAPLYRMQAVLLMTASVLPVAARLLQLATGTELFPRVDQVPLFSGLSLLLVALAVFRYGAIDVLPLARRLVVDNLASGVVFVDPQGRVLALNPEAARVWPHAAPLGRALAEVVPEAAGRVLQDGDEWQLEQAVGGVETRWYRTQVNAVEEGALGLVCYALVFIDVTASKRAELAMQEAMEVQRRFLANVSHELRTPLHAITGLLQLVRRDGEAALQTDYLDQADVSARTLGALIDDVLDLSRLQAGAVRLEAVPCDCDELAEDVESIVGVQAREARVDLVLEVDTPGRALRTDPLRLTQVLVNLTRNAVKFAPGGTVKLQIRTLRETPRSALVRFAVQDDGIGIPADRIDRVFDAFVQADDSTTRQFGGTGLGLAICRQLVERLGGEITVASTPGKGSVFAFSLELELTDELPVSSADAPTAALPDLRGRRVLLVDDAQLNRVVAEQILIHAGAEVVSVASGGEALAAFAEAGAADDDGDVSPGPRRPFDVVLMDLQMPDMDGEEATRRLRRLPRGAETPVLAVTANADIALGESAARRAFEGVLTKPFDDAGLLGAIQSVLGAGPRAEPVVRSARSSQAVFDRDEGLRLVRGDVELFESLVTDFLVELAAMREAGERDGWQGDAQRQRVHRIAGSAGLLGAERLRAAAETLEVAMVGDEHAVAGAHDDTHAGVAALLSAAESFVEAVEEARRAPRARD